MQKKTDGLRIVALGGLGEIGMNCLVLESRGRLLIIDCGVMFSNEGLGIDVIHPNFEYLAQRRDDIEGVVLTHAHEDHIAGVPYLLREVDVPVYGSSYALGLLGERVKEFEGVKLWSHVLEPGGSAQLDNFCVRSFPMPHSIIQNTGLVIDTPDGRVLHTGDFKLRLGAPDGGREVLDRLSKAAGDGVDLMLSDSTGSEEDEDAGEEDEVKRRLIDLACKCTGQVFVAIFSSNVRRLESLFEVALRCGRKVAFSGRSVENHVRVASSIGALRIPQDLVIPLEEVSRLPRGRALVVVSGTQGETRSALGRLADDSHRLLSVEPDDLVVFSSRFIPGNELAISNAIDNLHRLGARVLHRGVLSDIHVSGHGSSREIRKAIEAVSPRCFMPVHGTYRHLFAAAQLAREVGVPHVEVVSDGEVVRCDGSGLHRESTLVPTGRVYIDGMTGIGKNALRERRVLGANGILVVTFAAGSDRVPQSDIDVISRGVIQEQAQPWLADIVKNQVLRLLADAPDDLLADRDRLRDHLRSGLRKAVSKQIRREPYVVVSII